MNCQMETAAIVHRTNSMSLMEQVFNDFGCIKFTRLLKRSLLKYNSGCNTKDHLQERLALPSPSNNQLYVLTSKIYSGSLYWFLKTVFRFSITNTDEPVIQPSLRSVGALTKAHKEFRIRIINYNMQLSHKKGYICFRSFSSSKN